MSEDGAVELYGHLQYILKARRRVHLEPEWRFRRPVAVNVDVAGRIFVLEATRHRLQVYTKVKDFEDASLNL